MGVRKPLKKTMMNSIDIDALIEKGAEVKQDKKNKIERKWSQVHLRIPTETINIVDDIVYDRAGITRTGWILEAIHEKLRRSKDEA